MLFPSLTKYIQQAKSHRIASIFARSLTDWLLPIGILAVFYLTGWQTEVAGRIQQAVLATGMVQPDVAEKIVNQPAGALNLPLVTPDGKKINLSDFKGKVIFLNLWATWCPPCVAEMPNIHRLYQKVASDDIVFVMISVDEEAQKVKKFVERKKFTFPVYRPQGQLPATLQTQSIPTTFVIAPDGNIVMRQEGMATYDTEKFRKFLTELVEK